MKIYVGNMSYSSTENDLGTAFSEFGEVANVSIIHDRMSGRPKGFGFVEMPNDAEAQAAIDALNGKMLPNTDRALTVNEARPMEPRPPRGNNNNRRRY